MEQRPLSAFANGLREWSDSFSGRELPPLLAELPFAELDETVRVLARRLREGPAVPARVALFGPTGAGKSKIFCSLVGQLVSPPGFRRPSTREPVYYLHEHWRSIAAGLEGRVELHERNPWSGIILVDTPDFDSVEIHNRAEADRVLAGVDGVVFVTDGLKYADASTWDYVDTIRGARKLLATVLNKVSSETIVADFSKRLQDRMSDAPPVYTLPPLPIDDETHISPDEPGLAEIQALLDREAADDSRSRRVREQFERDVEDVTTLGRRLLDEAKARRSEIESLRAKLRLHASEVSRELTQRVETDVDPSVRAEVSKRLGESLEKLDIFRYPRRLLSLPFQGVRSALSKFGWLSAVKEGAGEKPGEVREAIPGSFHLLEAAVLRWGDRARRDVREAEWVSEELSGSKFRELRFDHDELLSEYLKRYTKFQEWAAEEAKKAAESLSSGGKVKFVLSQILFNSALVSVQFATGGAFTVFELAFDGAVSPYIAKAVGIAVTAEHVREFEAKVHEEHAKILDGIIELSRTRFDDFLVGLDSSVATFDAPLDNLASFSTRHDEICREFSQEGRPGSVEEAGSVETGSCEEGDGAV